MGQLPRRFSGRAIMSLCPSPRHFSISVNIGNHLAQPSAHFFKMGFLPTELRGFLFVILGQKVTLSIYWPAGICRNFDPGRQQISKVQDTPKIKTYCASIACTLLYCFPCSCMGKNDATLYFMGFRNMPTPPHEKHNIMKIFRL